MVKSTGDGNSPAAKQADFECQLRLKTLAAMREIDQPTALLADLLTDRYIRHLTIPQTVADLSTKYHQGYLAGLLTDIKTGPY